MIRLLHRSTSVLALAACALVAGCDEGPLEDLNQGLPLVFEVTSDTTGFNSAAPGAQLRVALRITDPYGTVVPNALVVWVPAGDGPTSVEPDDSTRTDAAGLTEAVWQLGERGRYQLTATTAASVSAEFSARTQSPGGS